MPHPIHVKRRRRSGPGTGILGRLIAASAAAAILASCQAAATAPRGLTFVTLNDSGVTGGVEFRDVGGRTEVEVRVEPAGNLDMPAHIHPGTCDNLTPQPKYPLENIRNGASTTVVPAGIEELFAGELALNIHRSNDDLRTYTACVDIR
jgi:hypothetical protein